MHWFPAFAEAWDTEVDENCDNSSPGQRCVSLGITILNSTERFLNLRPGPDQSGAHRPTSRWTTGMKVKNEEICH